LIPRSLIEEKYFKNVEIALMTKKDGLQNLEKTEIDKYVPEIEAEKSVDKAAKMGVVKDT
jgi:20S proteasome subunit alpha 4